ncbi:MAG: hypothetical protein U5J97_04375 [Trueperaceae bacterium]|nr:hypothetical protein [Trueperaceae bacterium]
MTYLFFALLIGVLYVYLRARQEEARLREASRHRASRAFELGLRAAKELADHPDDARAEYDADRDTYVIVRDARFTYRVDDGSMPL